MIASLIASILLVPSSTQISPAQSFINPGLSAVLAPQNHEPNAVSVGTNTSTPLEVGIKHKSWTMGRDIGMAGIEIGDLDGDGDKEVVVTTIMAFGFSSPSYWYVLEVQPDGSYAQTWVSDVYPTRIGFLALADYNGDLNPDVCISTSNKIRVYDGVTKAEIASIVTPDLIGQFAWADLDNDHVIEFIFSNGQDMVVYSEFGLEQRVSGMAGIWYAIGNILPDRTLEIVVVKGWEGSFVLNGRTRAVLIPYSLAYGDSVRLADVNGDGNMEFLTTFQSLTGNGKSISAYSSVSRTAIWRTEFPGSIESLVVGDIDYDGVPEVVVAQNQIDGIKVLDARNGSQKWLIDHGRAVKGLAFGNTDSDQAQEIVFGTTNTGPNEIHFYDAVTRTQEWESADDRALTYADFGDFDADGDSEFLLIARQGDFFGLDPVRWLVRNASTGALEYASPYIPGGARAVCHANVDLDRQQELFVLHWDGQMKCVDGLTYTTQYQFPVTGSPFVAADLDNDGQIELVGRDFSTNKIYVYDALGGGLEWVSPAITDPWGIGNLRVANVDSDSNAEIMVGQRNMFVFDGVTHVRQVATTTLNMAAYNCCDLNNDGIEEIVVADIVGQVSVRDPNTGGLVNVLGNFGSGIFSFAISEMSGNSEADMAFFQSGMLKVVSKDLFGVTRSWQSPPLYVESADVSIQDMDQNGKADVCLSMGLPGVSVYEVTP